MIEKDFLLKLKEKPKFKDVSFNSLKEIHNIYLETLIESLLEDGEVKIRNFGKFVINEYRGSTKKIAGKKYLIRPKKRLVFKTSRVLNSQLNHEK